LATFKELRGDVYSFQVEFNHPDGSLFVLGPCCGANETGMPPVSQFEFTVTRNAQGKFVVLDMSLYAPESECNTRRFTKHLTYKGKSCQLPPASIAVPPKRKDRSFH
jgi:hypothetical protein